MVFLIDTGAPENSVEPYEIGAATNENQLHNGYFLAPVNQRGFTTGSANTNLGYFLDRWTRVGYNAGVITQTDGTGLTINNASVTSGSSQIVQKLEAALPDNTYTLSVKVRGVSGSGTLSLATAAGAALASKTFTSDGVHSVTYSGSTIGRVYIGASAGSSITIEAVKLEVGAKQTLARLDEDESWVLSDPPPDKAAELAKCQRYFISIDITNMAPIGAGIGTGAGAACFFVPTPCEMRVNPTITGAANLQAVGDGSGFPISNVNSVVKTPAGLFTAVTLTDASDSAVYILCGCVSSGVVTFSADL